MLIRLMVMMVGTGIVTFPPQDRAEWRTASQPASRPAAAATPAGEFKLATLNVLNLFDRFDDPYTQDETTKEKPRAQLEMLASTIRWINADVLALEEVENRGCLERFVRDYLSDMKYRDIVLVEGNDTRGIDCALLSRMPVGPVTSHRHMRPADEPNGEPVMRRDLLQVRIDPRDGRPFDVFVVHLKSNPSDPVANALRIKEARAIRKVFDDRLRADPQARFAICGDFNDLPDSNPIRTILGTGDTALQFPGVRMAQERRNTYNTGRHKSMIDYIFCSPALARDFVADSYEITPGSPGTTGSDHNPVSARFKK